MNNENLMTIKDAIINTLGKDKFDGMIEAGVSDLSILENACLTAFLNPANTPMESTRALRESLAQVWNKPPDTFRIPKSL